ncbi:MAG: fimbrillin family protein [Bacteroidaceae bacterium]|nr:fimbrillin family protein [Bacteroidaceae bacterium]
MKKQFLLLGLAVAAMTSCTSDEVLEQVQPTKQAIGFESFVNKTTRAITTTDAPGQTGTDGAISAISGLSKFFVHGFYGNDAVVFNGIPVTRAITDGKAPWSYDLDTNTNEDDLAYWTRNIYQFGAYANGNNTDPIAGVEFVMGPSTVDLTIPSYTVTDNNDLVADIVTVDNSGLTNPKVDLSFEHMLTKVRFTVINNDAKYKMRIVEALVINGAKNEGECVISKNPNTDSNVQALLTSWTPAVGANAIEYKPNFLSTLNVGEDHVNSSINNLGTSVAGQYIAISERIISEEFLVMPQDLTNVVEFSIKAEFYDDNNQVVAEKELNLPVLGTEENSKQMWKANTVYNYTIGLPTSAAPIQFGTIGVSTWGATEIIELNTEDY